MKSLIFDNFKSQELTRQELKSIVAKNSFKTFDTYGGPDTDREEDCMPPPPNSTGEKLQGKYCVENK